MLSRLIVMCASLALGNSLWAQDEDALKQRVNARSQAVAELLSTGLVRESPNGLLQATAQLDAQQSQTVEAENRDRQAIFAIVSQKSKVTLEEVARLFAARAMRVPPSGTQAGIGPCKLTPTKDADVQRLLQYLKQGMNYASQKRFDLALAEFQPALAIDRNFLGLQQNIGAAQLALRHYHEAEAAFKAELKLVNCLAALQDNQIAPFGYFMEVEEKDPLRRKKAQSDKLKTELPKVKAGVHYNLACLYSKQRDAREALSQLGAAIEAGFSDRRALTTDPDLASVRALPEFREILARVR